jgi:ribosomal protein S12 methylthiotransferase
MNDSQSPPAVALVSLGCAKNLVDSEKMLAELALAGCVVGAELDEADVVLINTCGFVAAARAESLDVIAQATALKRAGRLSRVVVAGCLSQREGEALFELAPGIDAIVGVNDRQAVVAAVRGEDLAAVRPYDRSMGLADDRGRFRLTLAHSAYLRISEGCGQGCAFCTIPAIRGPFRSKASETVLAEAIELVEDGAVELNVIGQETTSYGVDRPDEIDLPALLRRLDADSGARWIRLMYAYPSGVDRRLLTAVAECENIVPYLDMPLQHVADGVLEAMRRRISGAETLELLRMIRGEFPQIALRTTLMVGFPGETEADFAELLAAVEEFRFDALGVFEYSPEPETPAAGRTDRVAPAVAQQRAERLMLAQQQIAFEANRRRLGRRFDVLVDGADEQGRYLGRHAGQAPEVDSVCYLTAPAPEGAVVAAEAVDFDEYDLIVRPIETSEESS